MSTSLKKTKLSLGEIYALEQELNGVRNPETGEVVSKGLLGQKGLNMKIRYYLSDLADIATADKKKIDSLKDELIIKLGVTDESTGRVTLPTLVKQKDEEGNEVVNEKGESAMVFNPAFIEFNEEMNKLVAEEKEFSVYPFTIEDFNVDTDESYPVLFKLMKSLKEEVLEPTE